MTIRCAEAEVQQLLIDDPGMVCTGIDEANGTIVVYLRFSLRIRKLPESHGGWRVVARPIDSVRHEANQERYL